MTTAYVKQDAGVWQILGSGPIYDGTIRHEADILRSWDLADLEAIGIRQIDIPAPPVGYRQSSLQINDDGFGNPVVDQTFEVYYPPLSATQFAEMLDRSGMGEVWREKEADVGSAYQLLLSARASAPSDIDQLVRVRDYLEDVGAAVPTVEDLQTLWLTVIQSPAPVPSGEPFDDTRLYSFGDTCTFNDKTWEWKLPYSVPGWEPGPTTWAAWKDVTPPSNTPQPWTQRTPGVDMYGVGGHPDGAAVIGTLEVTFGGSTYLLIAPDNWGFDPPTSISSIPAPNTPWQLVS